MATRTSFRPRPVDISRQLNIVRDVAELDKTDELDQAQTQAPVAVIEQAPHTQKKKKEVKEIPVPEVRIVPGYTREYLPLFRIPETYIRGKGGVVWSREDVCDYDLDNEDEDWLEAFNAGGANRLADDKFEQMLWRLELANAEANQRLMSEPGYATDWRMLPAAVAATGNMTREEAMSVLRKYVCARDAILHAVYDYWRGKRERCNKPILRRLQAPTNPSDTNPYNVFRPRERVNRPQTRRRRENTQDCLDKMRQIRESMLKSLELTELLTFREARKRDIHRLDVDMQRFQVARQHGPRHQVEAVEAEAAARLQEAQARSRQGEGRLGAYLESANSLGAPSISYDSPLRRALLRKRRRQDMEGCVNGEAISRLPPPPLPPDDEMLLLYTPDLTKFMGTLPQQQQPSVPSSSPSSPSSPAANGTSNGRASSPLVAAVPALDMRCVRPRISRCGRAMLTRCDPLTLEPHPPAPPPLQQPPQPNGGGDSGSGGIASSPPPSPFAARHPLLLSSQQPSLPWAAALDLDLLPEGVADKAALRSLRERRLNADRLNAAMLRQTQQTLHQQVAGGMVGPTSVAGAAAAAAAAAANAAGVTAAAAAGALPAPPASAAAAPPSAAAPAATQRPPPPPAVPNQGAPAGTLPHVPQAGAPAGTLPHVPAAGAPAAGATPLPPMPAAGVAGPPGLAGPAVAAGPLGATPVQPAPGPAVSAALPTPGAAPGSAGGQARKVPKVAPGPTPTPTPGSTPAATLPHNPQPPLHPAPPPSAAATPLGGAATPLTAATPAAAPGLPGLAPGGGPGPTPSAGGAAPAPPAAAPLPGAAGFGVGGPLAGTGAVSPPLGAPSAGTVTPMGVAAGAGGGSGASTPSGSVGGGVAPGAAAAAAAGGGGAGTVKKMLSTSKAVAGPSSASQLKRGPGRPPKTAKATANGDAPPSSTVPMDML